MKVGVGIGSNLGERGGEMAAAFEFLRRLDPSVRTSGIYESEPLDCPPDSPKFLNGAAVLNWRGGLFGLLVLFQDYEKARGRENEKVRPINAPRPVDLDILFCDDLILSTPRLVLPHPRMVGRDFVLRPLAELEPEFTLPGTGLSVQNLLNRLERNNPGKSCQKIL
jgi:2-amino-4-hydroxy-6-hydroxymethyldihydropteridine diphosphokinase